jgi:hypothetical protein
MGFSTPDAVEFEESGEDVGLLPPGDFEFRGDSGSDPGFSPPDAVEFDDGPVADEPGHDL